MNEQHPVDLDRLKTIFQRFRNLNILVVGDLILDQYIWGKVERISPEAPVPVLNVSQKEYRLGGAGNVAANLASLGCQAIVAGVCGEDEGGRHLLQLFEEKQIDPIITKTRHRSTAVKTRVIAQHQQVVRIDEETTAIVPKNLRRELLLNLTDSLKNVDGIILSDYAKGLLTEDLITELIRRIRPKPVLIDPKGYQYKKYHGATAIKPNFREFSLAVHHPEMARRDLEPYARKMVQDLALQGLIVTLGEEGVFILDNQGSAHWTPTHAREVYDVSGAGDTFMAAFTATLIASGDWLIAAQAANLASGIAVGKVGTATVTTDEIFRNYK